MKSIVTALNNIALSLNSIARAISQSKTVTPVSQTTSNGAGYNTTITSKIQYISSEEKVLLNKIYSALTDKGFNPSHHDKIRKRLREDWPVLSRALDDLEQALSNNPNIKIKDYYQKHSHYSQFDKDKNPTIWDFKKDK